MQTGLGIIDFDAGNIGSVVKMAVRMGIRPTLFRKGEDFSGVTMPLILPGVGHFSKACTSLEQGRLRRGLGECFSRGMPILGICLGAQLFCEQSEEGEGQGLGWVKASVRRFCGKEPSGRSLRVPQMGWREFSPPSGCLPFAVLPGRMYFAHSFYIEPGPDPFSFPCQATYGPNRFASVIRAGNCLGVQFHPEKSHRHGAAFLKNWLSWAQERIRQA